MPIINDIKTGKDGEEAVIKLLEGCGITCTRNLDRYTRLYYDVDCVENGLGSFKLEIKNDKYASRSGNIAIEFWNTKSDTPSGIDVTIADIWVHIVNDEIWFASADKLRDWIAENVPKKTIHRGGDGNAALYLYDVDYIFSQVFARVDKSSKQQLLDTLQRILEGV